MSNLKEKRFILIIEPMSRRISVNSHSTVYETFTALNFPINAFCGGRGSCGKCIIKIVDENPNINPPNSIEFNILGDKRIKQGYRLACQVRILGDLRIDISESVLHQESKILTDYDLSFLHIDQNYEIKPNIIQYKLKLIEPNLENPKNDFWCIIESIRKLNLDNLEPNSFNYNIDDKLYYIIKKIPFFVHRYNKDGHYIDNVLGYFQKNPVNYDNKISWTLMDIDEIKDDNNCFGLAIDIGTTTIVGYLIDLKSGNISAISALLNPQVVYGEDIISRITYIKKNNALKELQDSLIKAVNYIIDDSTKKAKINPEDIKDLVIVGNTAEHHIFYGLPTQYLAVTPFSPVIKNSISISAENLNLICHPNALVYSPPIIAGFVGSDTIGCIISSQIYKYEKYTLLIDIGTNGELVLGNKYNLTTGSCAAGSALEGAHIKFGMRAAEGSIEAISIDPLSLEPSIKIIGNVPPIGICGSGFIDLIAEMLKSKILTRSGKINKKNFIISNNKRIALRDGELSYILYKKEWDQEKLKSSGIEFKNDKSIEEIYITQNDIRQIQLAKGAFLSGAYVLLQSENKKYTDLENIILAGAFGTYINKNNAAFIGLFPNIESNKIYQIGNAAGLGAQMFIKNVGFRNIANDIANKIKYYEIASNKLFQKEYAYSLYFPHYDIERFPSLIENYKEIPLK